MKRLLLLSLLLISCYGSFASTFQGSYRWRNDDGDEATATWKAAENTPITIGNTDTLRLRIEYYNIAPTSVPVPGDLSYSDGTTSTALGTDPTAPFYYIPSTQVPNGTLTTDQLTSDLNVIGTTFIPGAVISGLPYPLLFIGQDEQTELEWVFRPGAGIATNTTYTFSNGFGSGATLTTAAVLPVWLVSFTAMLQNNGVHLQWVTGAERNSDRFEVMRSDDGRTWQCIATRKGAGNSSRNTRYEVGDRAPNGVAFYRLDQYDEGGAISRSAVQTVQSTTRLPEVTASPNPLTGTALHLHVPISAKADVSAVLTDVTGAVVYRTTIHTEPARLDYTLTLSRQPAPGLYYLRLEAQALSRTIPITVP